jgi:hypothetical protein
MQGRVERFVAACCLLAAACGAAWAQPATDCPASGRELSLPMLYGQWEARIDGQSGIATVTLERHPDYEGVRGTVERAGQPPAQLAGDIDPEGLLALDESQDGKSISASWSGELQGASCGKEFKGSWRRGSDDSSHDFVLHKASTWK